MVNWGVLGTANIAKHCTVPGLCKAENASLYAIAGRDEAKVLDFKERFGFEKGYVGYEKLLGDEKVQAVYIPLPNHLHYEWVMRALNAGKHVLCEKPLALSKKEAELMYETARKNNVLLMEAYAYLHGEYMSALKKDIDEGIIGDIRYIDTAFATQGYSEDIRLYKDMGGGAIYDLGCYCTTMILSLIDSRPETVKAVSEFSDRGVDFNTSAVIRFEDGKRASFNVGMILGNDSNARYDRLYINGTEGYIKSDVEYNQAGEISYTVCSKGEIFERKVKVTDNYALEAQNLSECIEKGQKPYVTEAFSLRNAELMDRVLESSGYRNTLNIK